MKFIHASKLGSNAQKNALLIANRERFSNMNAQIIERLNQEQPAIPGVRWGGGDAVLISRDRNERSKRHYL